MMDPHYHINVFWSEDDECWLADVPDLHPCTSHGESPEEATANIRDAIQDWLEVARDKGFDIPEPRYRPAIYARLAA